MSSTNINDNDEKNGDNAETTVLEPQLPTSAVSLPPPPPDGGLTAWLQVLGAHFLFFSSWGIVNTFGAYQTYYETDLLKDHSASAISWIGTFEGFLLIVFSVVVGPIFDWGFFRPLLCVGSFLIVFGLMMTSLGKEYWQIFLAQGLCVGLGAGCVFLPSVAIVATYFTARRGLAMGISAAGGSVGSVIYTVVFHRLQPQIGFAWTTRIIGFIAMATMLISIAVMKTRLPPSKHARKLFDITAFRSAPFVVFSIALFLAFVGIYIPFFYIVIYAERNIGIDENLSFYMLSILNASSLFGRIIPGLLADKFGSLEILIAAIFLSAIMSYILIAIHSLAGIVVFAILYGFFQGAVVSLPTTVVARLIPDFKLLGTWLGMNFSFAGLGILIGSPVAGTLVNIEENKFSRGYIFSASTFMAAGVLCVLTKFSILREKKGTTLAK